MNTKIKQVIHLFYKEAGNYPLPVKGRIVAMCEAGKKEPESCNQYQVELRTSDGSYIPLYNLEALHKAKPVEQGETAEVFLTPDYFVDHPYGFAPSLPIPHNTLKQKVLTEGFKKENRKIKPNHIYFDGQNNAIPNEHEGTFSLPSRYLIKGGEDLFTSEAKAFLEDQEQSYHRQSAKWKEAQLPPVHRWALGQRKAIQITVEELARKEQLLSHELMDLLKLVMGKKSNSQYLSPSIGKMAQEVLNRAIGDPQNLKFLVAYFYEESQKEGSVQSKEWFDRLIDLQGVIGNYLITTTDRSLLPSIEHLLFLADTVIQLQPHILIAAKTTGETNPTLISVARRLLKAPQREMAEIRLSAYFQLSALMPDEEIIPLFRKALKDSHVPVQTFAAATLLHVKDPQLPHLLFQKWKENQAQTVQVENLKIDPGMDRRPPSFITGIVEDFKHDQRVENALKTNQLRTEMDLVTQLPRHHGEKTDPFSQKQLLLGAFDTIGFPEDSELTPFLIDVVRHDRDSVNAQLALQSLAKIDRNKAIAVSFSRLKEEPSSKSFLHFAINLCQIEKDKQFLPVLYQVALLHSNKEVRQHALSVAMKIDSKTVLHWLKVYLESKESDIQLRVLDG